MLDRLGLEQALVREWGGTRAATIEHCGRPRLTGEREGPAETERLTSRGAEAQRSKAKKVAWDLLPLELSVFAFLDTPTRPNPGAAS